MKENDNENKLEGLTKDDLALYNLDGTEINKEKTLLEGGKFKDPKKGQYQQYVIDFKNIIVLRLLGQNEFIYVKFSP